MNDIFNRKRNCEECEGNDFPGPFTLQDLIWKSQLEKFREIYINGEIDEKVIEKVVAQIQNINRIDALHAKAIRAYEPDPITVFLNTPGGLLAESMSVADTIMCSKTPVRTVALGNACSGGFLILLAGDLRYAQEHSTVLYHQGMGGYIGKFQDYFEHGDYLLRLQSSIVEYVLERTSLTLDDLQSNLIHKQDWIFTLDELIHYNIIDGVWGMTEVVANNCPSDCECNCDTDCPLQEGGR